MTVTGLHLCFELVVLLLKGFFLLLEVFQEFKHFLDFPFHSFNLFLFIIQPRPNSFNLPLNILSLPPRLLDLPNILMFHVLIFGLEHSVLFFGYRDLLQQTVVSHFQGLYVGELSLELVYLLVALEGVHVGGDPGVGVGWGQGRGVGVGVAHGGVGLAGLAH